MLLLLYRVTFMAGRSALLFFLSHSSFMCSILSSCNDYHFSLPSLSLSLSLSLFISKVRDTLAKVRKLSRQLYAFNIIRRNFYAWKLRKVINDRIYNKKCLPATLVIQKYYRGWKVKVCLTIVGERERERES